MMWNRCLKRRSRPIVRLLKVLLFALVIATVVLLLWPAPKDPGNSRFFRDPSYDFEALRVLNDVASVGGDSGEALQAIGAIQGGDAEGWYRSWDAVGDRTVDLAGRTTNLKDKGNALLRAQTYYRSAEFFLAPEDSRRAEVFNKGLTSFYEGLDTLKVVHERIAVPFGQNHLNAVYYPGPPGAAARPLLVVVGGYDSTLEELYLGVGPAAYQHGYSLLTYEGPGQGSVLREQGLHMQPEWEKPNGAVLDTFLASHAKPAKIVLVGESLGGYLAPRAAAFEPRIDGVVAFDIWYDGYAIATRHVPSFVFWLHAHGYDKLLNSLSQSSADTGSKWAVQNGQWVFGVHGVFAVLDTFKSYRMAPVAAQIKQDVLLLAGADDHFVPIEQLGNMRDSLRNARSVTAITFDRESGGAQHCQIGAPSLWQAALFDWMDAKFPSG
jgi:pimeloyl-ACP methyl ester carboxylesterase